MVALARWLILVIALGLGTTAAEAQVFKPKAAKKDKADKGAKKASAEPAPKKQPRAAQSKKRVTTKAKKSSAADRARPDDLTPEPASKEADKDYVKIWDDETVE